MSIHSGVITIGDVALGEIDEFGVEWVVTKFGGWTDNLGSTGTVEQKAGDDGGWASPANRTARGLVLEGFLQADSWEDAVAAIERLWAAIPIEVPDWLTVDGTTPRQIKVRQDGQPLSEVLDDWARFSISLVAPDPYKYATGAAVALSTGLPLVTGGLVLPITFPLTIGATYSAGTLVAVNDGSADTFPTFTLTGPVPTGATITHEESGAWLRYDQPIAAGHTLTIDTETRTALLDGSAPRTLVGTWFAYSPGDNTVRFTASTYDAAALLTSSHRSAWR